uniref:Uncharacterized protein n=1 Tax=Nelumbo nucifera TaxID=4432 RepID=A0A822Y616_NELNU|nr:TPA_asm: hypothetical protein HUJ06_029427 [Nelumbo nucifera]
MVVEPRLKLLQKVKLYCNWKRLDLRHGKNSKDQPTELKLIKQLYLQSCY